MASSCDVDEVFRLFTIPAGDFFKSYLIVDIRDKKYFEKGHINQAFCVRLAANGQALLDYSKAEYHAKWSQDCWVGKKVYVYGDANMKKDHPAIAFMAKTTSSIKYLRDGYESFEKAYPFLCTTSVKANIRKEYPSQIITGLLYLGDWANAEAGERLAELNIRRVVTIHNHPENLKSKLAPHIKWLPFELPDVDCADITPMFNETFEFIEEAKHRKHAVLVHCGAGVSRSATLVMMYLMRANPGRFNAQRAKDLCVERRPVVCPNDGFWRTLCSLEATLGITDRSNPEGTGFHGVDFAAPAVGSEAVGGKVAVVMVGPDDLKRKRGSGDGDSEDSATQQAVKRARAQGMEGVEKSVSKRVSVVVTLDIVREGDLIGQVVVGPLGLHQKVIFGRLPSNDIVAEHASISRQHCALSIDMTGVLLLTDLGSGHGTKLDDTWLRPNAPKQVREGSCIKLAASSREYKVSKIDKCS